MPDDCSNPLRFLPLGLSVRSRRCLVVGGGDVGTRKALTLQRAGASVTVVSPAVTAELARAIDAGDVRWVKDAFEEAHLDGGFLVVAATDDPNRNRAVVHAAAARGMPACDASSAERSEVIFGALYTNDDVTVAVFTDGRDPARARRTRDRIADLLDRDAPGAG